MTSNEVQYFSTELQNSKPCREISLTLDDSNFGFYLNISRTVTGEANFSIKATSLLLEVLTSLLLLALLGNAEKDLSQRFLWLFPQPVYGTFETLEPIKEEFVDNIGN